MQQGIAVEPALQLSRCLAAALCRLGRAHEAKAVARRVLELEPRFSIAQFVKSHTGRPEIWNPVGDALRQVGLPD